MPTENSVQYYVPRYSALTYLSLALLLLQIHFSFFFATRIIIVACSISEKKLQCATTTLEKNTKRYFMSFSTLRIRNIAKAEWTLPHLGNLVKGVTFVDHQARRLCICLTKKKEICTDILQQLIELMYVSTISFASKFLSNSSWPLHSYGLTFKANDAKIAFCSKKETIIILNKKCTKLKYFFFSY